MPRAPTSPRLGAAPEPSKKRSKGSALAVEKELEVAVLPAQAGAGPEECPQLQRKEEDGPRKKKSRKALDEEAKLAEPDPASADQAEASPEEVENAVLSPDAFRSKFFITSAREGQRLPDPVQSFDEAPFGKRIRKALQAAGFAAPSPIQAQGWPIAVNGNDLVAVAKTGSGKTLCFLLPAFLAVAQQANEEQASSKPAAKPLVLVLAPTRELATQIDAECSKFAKVAKVRSQAVFGGMPKQPQAKALQENPQVLVATPGRLQDLMEMNAVSLGSVQVLVLDEADRMLDMGFEPEIAKILTTIPAERQTLLFTATWPKAVKKIASSYLKSDYVHVNVGQTEELAANRAVSQEFYKLDDDEKDDKLWRILDGLSDDAKVIVFNNTKRRVESLAKNFRAKGYEMATLHGDKAQRDRDRDLANFASGKTWLLFATDVCARGLDIRGVTHVVNLDMARDVESYVHRIGRTGRAGATGTSITFWNEAYDTECAPALVKIAKEAGQEVPEWLEKAAAKQTQVKNKAWRY